MSESSQIMTATSSSRFRSCGTTITAISRGLVGAGRRALNDLLCGSSSEEEKSVAILLLPEVKAIHKFPYYFRLVRYAGFNRWVAARRALYWTI